MSKKYIYGAGVFGVALAKHFKEIGINTAFIDAYKTTSPLEGISLFKPGDIPIYPNDTLYIAALMVPIHKNVDEDLQVSLSKYSWSIVDTYKTFKLYPKALEYFMSDGYMWRQRGIKPLVNSERINELRALLSDSRSLELLEKIERFRADALPENYPIPDIGCDYFPNDFDPYEVFGSLSIADCGSFDGNSCRDFLQFQGHKIKNYYAFEPDPDVFQSLTKKMQVTKQEYPSVNFVCMPTGVGSEVKILTFQSGLAGCSHLDEKGDIQVPIVNLDSILSGTDINFIKIDVEGAEIEVLEGAKQLIINKTPGIAVSLYHVPEHLWQVPLLINKYNKNYNMYLRQHNHWGMELTLYCVPIEI
ncbi:FkbM family methyltransferase [Pseudoalteromonas sp. MMG012]|uniref:FkbM family methyltransferase n=1 Tax=Pseudoalteromonas sp. MMG012 TaxID=2822686 RepID=UPI001B39EB59|nr:FkbM family methyltransferase [Pseudoalteromonas sp. MMG012]MBQ4849014.1 FkbM family methyltransferase [Pseudoalteromonas sp. MMG012]